MNEEELKKGLTALPCWASVAFAVRCGLRVLPLFEAKRPRDRRVRTALEFAAKAARTADGEYHMSAGKTASIRDCDAAQDAADEERRNDVVAAAARTAAYASQAYAAAVMKERHLTAGSAVGAAIAHENAVYHKTGSSEPAVLAAGVDFDRLQRMASDWDDDTPVDPDDLGPLWPEEPSW